MGRNIKSTKTAIFVGHQAKSTMPPLSVDVRVKEERLSFGCGGSTVCPTLKPIICGAVGAPMVNTPSNSSELSVWSTAHPFFAALTKLNVSRMDKLG